MIDLTNETDWISVKDRLPYAQTLVLVLRKEASYHPYVAYLEEDGEWRTVCYSETCLTDNIGWWMPIPNQPALL